jgi:hypothetical protein
MVSFICIVITIVQFYLFIILISIYFPLKTFVLDKKNYLYFFSLLFKI